MGTKNAPRIVARTVQTLMTVQRLTLVENPADATRADAGAGWPWVGMADGRGAGMLTVSREDAWSAEDDCEPGELVAYPQPDDPIVPSRRGGVRNRHRSRDNLLDDLRRLGLRHRRQHDLRRTFITLARVDGAQRHLGA